MNCKTKYDDAETLTQEILRKEILAEDAKNKGMFANYSSYKADAAQLKLRLKKLRTDPNLREV